MTDHELQQVQRVIDIEGKVNLSVKLLWTIVVGAVVLSFAFGVWISDVRHTIEKVADGGADREARLKLLEGTYFRKDDIALLVEEVFRRAGR